MQDYIVIDVETTGLDWKTDRLHGIGMCGPQVEMAYISVGNVSQILHTYLANPKIAKVGHNIRFDLKFLHAAGFKIAGPIWDTRLMAQLLNENQELGLKVLTERFFGKENLADKSELDRVLSRLKLKHVGQLCELDLKHGGYYNIIAKYCMEDVRNTDRLFQYLGKKFKDMDAVWKEKLGLAKTPFDYLKTEATPLEPVLLDLELRGIPVDPQAIESKRQNLKLTTLSLTKVLDDLCPREIEMIEEELLQKERSKKKSEKGKNKVQPHSARHKTRFMWSSSIHVGQLLELKGCTLNKTAKGFKSTAEKDLKALASTCPSQAIPVISNILNLREYQKMMTTYAGESTGLVSKIHNGRVYSQYLQGRGTVTGRLASAEPNMQNLPRAGGIKKFFVPDPGYVFLYFDYSQVELRIAAHLSQDPKLLEGYLRGLDLHRLTASQIFRCAENKISKEQRQVGKTINFAMIFDASAYRLAEELNKNGAKYSEEQCEQMRQAFFNTYSRYKAYLREQLRFVEETGVVVSEAGRIRRLPEIRYKDGINWARRTWEGTTAQRLGLQDRPDQVLSPEEAFWRAKKKYRHAVKQAYNFPVQSLGGTITKQALIRLSRAGYDIVTTVHDSIVVQVSLDQAAEAFEKIKHIMEYAYPLSVPLVAEGKVLTSLDESDIVNLTPQKEVISPLKEVDTNGT